MDYVKHPLIAKDSIESRAYQESILGTAIKSHTLCVLPTGLGKTNVAMLLAAHRLETHPRHALLSHTYFALLVKDQAHHSIGGYAYPYVAKLYLEQSRFPRILALTASPGGTAEKINEIKENLGTECGEIRTDEDYDVKPWIKEKQIEWAYVEL